MEPIENTSPATRRLETGDWSGTAFALLLVFVGGLTLLATDRDLTQYGLVQLELSDRPPRIAEINEINRNANRIGAGQFVAAMLTWILCPIWVGRAAARARKIDPRFPHSPEWAVGSLFIPIVQFLVPLRTVSDLVRAAAGKRYWGHRPIEKSVMAWWGAWIVASTVSHSAKVMSFDPNLTPEDLNTLAHMLLFFDVALAVACVAGLLVIRNVAGLWRQTPFLEPPPRVSPPTPASDPVEVAR